MEWYGQWNMDLEHEFLWEMDLDWDLTNIPEDRDPRRFYHLPEIWQAREATMAVLSICRDMLS